MNIAANIGAGAELLQRESVKGATVNGPGPQTGSMAAWKPRSGEGAGWTGNARAGGSSIVVRRRREFSFELASYAARIGQLFRV